METVYDLVSVNLTGLGGRMGTERTWTNWRKLFKTKKSAKEYAQTDSKVPLKWYKKEDNKVVSQDLGHTQYAILLRKINE